jgi:hypothetical protein
MAWVIPITPGTNSPMNIASRAIEEYSNHRFQVGAAAGATKATFWSETNMADPLANVTAVWP